MSCSIAHRERHRINTRDNKRITRWMKTRLKKVTESKPRDAFGQLVETLTNHNRSLWARAGYPGLRNREEGALRPYLPKGTGKPRKAPRKPRVKREHL